MIDFKRILSVSTILSTITVHYQTKIAETGRWLQWSIFSAPNKLPILSVECLVLGVYDENNDVILLKPERPALNGQKLAELYSTYYHSPVGCLK